MRGGTRRVAIVLMMLGAALASARGAAGEGFMRGVALGLHSKEGDFDYGPFLREIEATGANWTSLFFSLSLDSIEDVTPEWPAAKAPRWNHIARAARTAHETGLKVMLFPITLVENPEEGEWRGVIEPADRAAWHANYRELITDIARRAEALGVEALAVGSEFVSMERDRAEWLATIAATRRVFSGLIVYSANWDHYRPVSFWDAVDVIAISGYYEIGSSNEPRLRELLASWDREKEALLAWRRRYPDKRLIFSEIGYPNLDGASEYPWDYTREREADPAEQALCYRAFAETWRGEAELDGVFFYNWWPNTYDEVDTGYSPRGKPAEAILREFFDWARVWR